jgi:hypothetical protein
MPYSSYTVAAQSSHQNECIPSSEISWLKLLSSSSQFALVTVRKVPVVGTMKLGDSQQCSLHEVVTNHYRHSD